jgi:hypothetical protein
MHRRFRLALILPALAGCSPKPLGLADIEHYTGLRPCEGSVARDLTTNAERNTTPGFSFHVQLQVPPACTGPFEAQVRALPGAHCGGWPQSARTCFVEDEPKGRAQKHTNVAAHTLGGASYDLRLWE